MNRRMRHLQNELALDRAAPAPDTASIKRRVNSALNADPTERKAYMRQKIKFAAVLVAAMVALTGTAVAVASNMDVLQAYFDGDTSSADALVDREVRSVSDRNYTFTVESSVSDGENAFLLVRIDALSEEGKAKLNSDDWDGMDLFNIYPLVEEKTGDLVHPTASNTSYGEVKEARTETSRSYTVNPSVSSDDLRPAVAIHARMGYMEKGLSIQVPLDPVALATIQIGAEGEGAPSCYNYEAGSIRVDSIELSPFTCKLSFTWWGDSEDAPTVPILFRMKDGTLRGFAQATETSGQSWNTDRNDNGNHDTRIRRFREIMDLDRLSGIVLWGKEYPLDGSAPRDVTVDSHLLPFSLPLMEGLNENISYSIPVRALMDALGGTCVWDNTARTATLRYRDSTVVLTWGSTSILVDGVAQELDAPPQAFEGKLCVSGALCDLWDLEFFAPFNEKQTDRVCWIIVP